MTEKRQGQRFFFKLKESILGSVLSIDRDRKMYLPQFFEGVLYYVC